MSNKPAILLALLSHPNLAETTCTLYYTFTMNNDIE